MYNVWIKKITKFIIEICFQQFHYLLFLKKNLSIYRRKIKNALLNETLKAVMTFIFSFIARAV